MIRDDIGLASIDWFRNWVFEAEADSCPRFMPRAIVSPPNDKVPAPGGELLWEVDVDRIWWRAELFDEQPCGFDVRLFCAGSFFTHRRFADRESAIAWAEGQWVEFERHPQD